MIINEAGEYTLQYTATDACGNSTTVERDLTVLPPPRTVLYTDGTLIINERPQDIAANIQAHGQPTNVYDPFDPNGATNVKKYIFSNYSSVPWYPQRASIKQIEIGSTISPTSTAYWFYGLATCTTIDMQKLNTSSVTNMSNMFYECSAITTLDVSNFDTSSVTDMIYMFYRCSAITTLNVSGFNTSSVEYMQYMFCGCNALTTLDVSNFNTSLVKNMSSMFEGCISVTALDVSHFNTSSVTNMSGMFYNCQTVTSLDVSNFDTSNVTVSGAMFSWCKSIVTLDVSSFKTNLITNMNNMFRYCMALTTIYASSDFVVTQVTYSNDMFEGDTNLVGGAGTTYNSSYRNKARAKIDGGVGDEGYFTAKS